MTPPQKPTLSGPALLALAGAVLQLLGIVASAIAYSYTNIEPYSCLNHFISELGWPQRSNLAWLFNANLTVGSLLYAPLIYALARQLRSGLGYLAMVVGFCSLLSAAGIGCYPIMQHLRPHLLVAFLFFSTWGATALLFALAVGRSPRQRWSNFVIITGCIAFVAAMSFLLWPKGDLPTVLRMLKSDYRPFFWWPAALEWGVLVSFYLWILAVSLFLPDESRRVQQLVDQ